jgi:phosphohistidine phosphatase
MELYVLRHAIAAEPGMHRRDAERPLTDEGRARLEKIVKAFAPLDVKVDRVLTSPYVRARQTATVAAHALDAPLVEVPALASGADPEGIVAAVREHADAHASVMIVGHEPDLGRLVTFLVSGDDQGGVRMKKAGLVKLSVGSLRAGRCAVLEWSLWPRHLVALGGG